MRQKETFFRAHKLDFIPVPEITADEVELFIISIIAARKEKLETFGAFLVRKGGAPVSTMITGMLREPMAKEKLKPMKATFGLKKDTPLHIDSPEANAPTIHRMYKGQVGFILVQTDRANLHKDYKGKWPLNYTSSSEEFTQEENYRMLLTSGIFDDQAFAPSLPDFVMNATLSRSDVLVFDDSLPHAFKTLTEARISKATYFDSE